MTHVQRLAELNAHPDVLVAWLSRDFALEARTTEAEPRTIHTGTYTYLIVEGATIRANLVRVYAIDLERVGEATYWMENTPEVLRPAAPGTKFLTGRTVNGWAALTETQQRQAIQDFSNAAWKAFANPTAQDIREFSASPIDASTVMVTGWFDTPTAGDPWNKYTYYIHLVDPDGSVAVTVGNTNFRFELRAEA